MENGYYYPDTQIFGGQDIGENATIICAPVMETGFGSYNIDKDEIEIISFSDLEEDVPYDMHLFSQDAGETVQIGVMPCAFMRKLGEHLAVMKSVSKTLDTEGNEVIQYTFIQSGETMTLTVDYDAVVYNAMSIGDVFRYAVNSDGEIERLELIYDASQAAFNNTLPLENLDINNAAIVYGKIVKIEDDKMTIESGTTGYAVPTMRLNSTEGNTYASIDEVILTISMPSHGVKVLAGPDYLRTSYSAKEYYVVAFVSEDMRYEDCVMIVKAN